MYKFLRTDTIRGRKTGKGSSAYIGVCFHKPTNRWRSYVNLYSKQHSCGLHKTEKEAAVAYNKKALELLGEKAKLNVIED